LFKSKPIANQAFTASARIPPEMRQKITEGLLSPQGEAALAKLREEFKGQKFVPASREEYEGLGMLLRDVWGFDPDAPARTAKDTAVKNRTAAH
jgi:ABC-type phosphate/phosphonate transport system substrate-binding protein